jgi:hypothetical protein
MGVQSAAPLFLFPIGVKFPGNSEFPGNLRPSGLILHAISYIISP